MSVENVDRNIQILIDKETMTYRQLSDKYKLSHNTLAKLIYRMRLKRQVLQGA